MAIGPIVGLGFGFGSTVKDIVLFGFTASVADVAIVLNRITDRNVAQIYMRPTNRKTVYTHRRKHVVGSAFDEIRD